MAHNYYVYILASRSRTLYPGVTNNLERRMLEHRQGVVPGFTSRYQIFRLVHYEVFGDIRYAIAREKEIESRRREKKIWLIERDNPTWDDFTERLEIRPRPEKGTTPGTLQKQGQQNGQQQQIPPATADFQHLRSRQEASGPGSPRLRSGQAG